jgi:hypothetical protein
MPKNLLVRLEPKTNQLVLQNGIKTSSCNIKPKTVHRKHLKSKRKRSQAIHGRTRIKSTQPFFSVKEKSLEKTRRASLWPPAFR